ncbi:Uncharacterised protein [Mycobacteroides abscessus]|nr:Uncharacterised protein [Mycobacteroides abscessus]
MPVTGVDVRYSANSNANAQSWSSKASILDRESPEISSSAVQRTEELAMACW